MVSRSIRIAVLGALFGLWLCCWPARAAAVLFDLPVDCGDSACLIQNYVDHDPGPGWRDYACGLLSYDGHEGTDFRVSAEAMERGVAVRAAAAGRVMAIRDGEPDHRGPEAPQNLGGRDAGNAVRLDHGNGWTSQYSHLKRGSVAVAEGQWVERGQVLGMVGLSGMTVFPHVELMVHHDGRVVDPFVGLDEPRGCRAGEQTLWSEAALAHLGYREAGLLDQGFGPGMPDLKATYAWGEKAEVLETRAPALVYWAALFGVRKGDTLRMRILAPDGSVFAQNETVLDKNQAQRVECLGRKRTGAAWPAGRYEAECLLARPVNGRDKVLVQSRATVEVR